MVIKKRGIKEYFDPNDIDWEATHWWVIKEDADELLSDEEILEELNLSQHYGGPGREFSRRPYVRRNSRGRILVTQDSGFDI